MTNRGVRGFTLLEIMLALTLTGVVVALAYGAMQAGLDTRDRLTSRTAATEGGEVARTMMAQSLRHALPGVRGGPPTFSLTDRASVTGAPADSLTFLSRGIVEPFGTGDAWRVTIWREGDSTRFVARPVLDDAGSALRSAIGGDEGLDVEVLGRGDVDAWRTSWDEPDVTPDAVSIAWGRSVAAAPRTVVRIGLERAP